MGILWIVAFITLLSVETTFARHTWDYEIKSFDVNCSTNILISRMRAKRVSRGQYGISGNVTVNEDLDDSIIAEVKLYRSAKGNNQYDMNAFRVAPTPFYDFLNNYYARYIMKDLSNYSNLPQRDVFNSPIPKGEYYVNDYMFDQKNFPSYMQVGTYKLIGTFKKDADFVEVVLVVAVSSRV